MARAQDTNPKNGKTEKKAPAKEKFITQKAFNEHFGLDSYGAKNLVMDGLVKANDRNQIAESELSRPKDEIESLAAGATRHSLTSAGAYLGVSAAVAKRLISNSGIQPIDGYRGQYHNWVSLYAQRDLDEIKQSEEYKKSLERSRKRIEGARKTVDKLAQLKEEIASRVKVNIRTREHPLADVRLLLGPTNSGKTFAALAELKRAYESNPTGSFVYAGPLRLLAYEVYEKMVSSFGEDAVGFITGEERVNENAPIKCCTVECAPMDGDVLVLDETHWLIDEDRGMHWTNLLTGGRYSTMLIIAAQESASVIKELTKDRNCFEETTFARLLPVEYAGKISVDAIPPRSAIVAFSRKAVFAIAREVSKRTKRKVGVLYGAMPLANRKQVLDKYAAGEYDVIVCTDVIGHGINLPIDNIVIAETQKFDGKERRSLKRWEAAQIIGRAGRYGISDENGKAYALTGLPWLSPNVDIVKNGVAVANGEMSAALNVDKVFITPSFEDIGAKSPSEVMYAMECWEAQAKEACRDTVLRPSPMPSRKALVEAIASYSDAHCYPRATAADRKWKMSAEQLWQLSGAPLDPNSSVLIDIVEWANSDDRETSDALILAIRNLYEQAQVKLGEQELMRRCEEKRAAFETWAHSLDDEDTSELEAEMKRLYELACSNRTVSNKRKKTRKWNKKERKAAKSENRAPIQKPLPPFHAKDGSEITKDGDGKIYNMAQWEREFWNVPLGEDNIRRARKRMERGIDDMIENARHYAEHALESQELAYKKLCQIETIYNIFHTIGNVDIEDVWTSVRNTCANVEAVLNNAIKYNKYGICQSCGGQCAPWFFECDKCHRARPTWEYDQWGYGEW